MINVKINSASFCFIGVFPYEDKYLDTASELIEYEPFSYYEENKEYFDQKYYTNWIYSFIKNAHNEKVTSNHLQLKSTHPLLNRTQKLIINQEKTIDFLIKEISVFFPLSTLGIFIVKVDLPNSHLNWKDIVKFGYTFRQLSTDKVDQNTSYAIQLIEKHITSKFHTKPRVWRQYNPLLKSAIFIDINKQIQRESLDRLMYQVGTHSMSFENEDLYEPEENYFQDLISKNQISLFKNWKALCLYDSICRIAVNLNEKDKFNIWENEYILIYVYVLYTRYFLHYTNKQLTLLFEDTKVVEDLRNKFFNFRTKFNHTKISYKFLPNIIYDKLEEVLSIQDEVKLIEEKLTRVSLLRQEKNQKRINSILLTLTILTLIPVANDGGQMLKKWEWSQSLEISTYIILISSVIILFLFYNKKR